MFKTWAEVKNADWIYNNEDRRCKHKIFLYVGKTPGFLERKSVPSSILVLRCLAQVSASSRLGSIKATFQYLLSSFKQTSLFQSHVQKQGVFGYYLGFVNLWGGTFH